MAKRRPDEDDDLGFRTPTKRPTGKRPREEAPEPEREDEPAPKAKQETGRTRRKEPEPPPAPAASAPARASGKGGKALPLLLGLGVAGLVGGVALAVLSGGAPPPPIETTRIQPERPKQPDRTPEVTTPAAVEPRPVAPPPVRPQPEPEPVEAPTEAAPPEKSPRSIEDVLAELATRSGAHAEVARALEEFLAVIDPTGLRDPGPGFENYLERRRQEEALLERIRSMGPHAVEALQDMFVGLEHQQFRLFLGKALAGIPGPEALGAVGALLGQFKDVPLQTTLVRYLPQTPESADLLATALQGEEDANLRCMLIKEYSDRLGGDLTRGSELFRQAATGDPNPNVRAEAVTILGRRGDPADQQLLEQIARNEPILAIRQRAIEAYGQTGKEAALPYLEQLTRDPSSSQNVAASAVLAIGKVGGDQALATLDLLAQTHHDEEIRRRANRLAQSLRRAKERNPEDEADVPPIRVGPGATPIERH